MPLMVSEVYKDDRELFSEAVYPEKNVSFAAILDSEGPRVITAALPTDELSYIYAHEPNQVFTPNGELENVDDPDHLVAIMRPGDRHPLNIYEDQGVVGMLIRHLKVEETDIARSKSEVDKNIVLQFMPEAERGDLINHLAQMITVARAQLVLIGGPDFIAEGMTQPMGSENEVTILLSASRSDKEYNFEFDFINLDEPLEDEY